MSSVRKVQSDDRDIIQKAISELSTKLSQRASKAIYQYIDYDRAVEAIMAFDHAYIVDGYLVVYDFIQPWFVREDCFLLAELLVLRVEPSGASKFSSVPRFLEKQAREAGCKLAVVGTALATADAALASLYSRHGFTADTITLTKGT